MATPLTAARFLQALRDEGCTVVEVGDWRNHNRNQAGAWGPVHGVMIHHTVTSGSARTVELCRTGYTNLPGPLCHGVITKDGRIHLVGYGRANHAGAGDPDVLRAVIDERALPADNEASTDGNRHFYGFECENLGDGQDPWPAAQVDAIVRASAALCRAHGWGQTDGSAHTSTIGHMEWQPGKVDPRPAPGGADVRMPTLRARVAERLKHPPNWNPDQEDDVALTEDDVRRVADAVVAKLLAGGGALENGDLDRIWSRDVIPAARPPYANADYEQNKTWTPKYTLQTTAEHSREAVAVLKQLAAQLSPQALAAAVREALADEVTVHLDITTGEG
ncbi:N-acetylmuramoyl-L-alanine amidase [Streptomyces sp. JB150]|uniref:peptidoglycan recognition protein family protein n=1 Tax=Streptomyces sp. JB150 TaxID=2714844 RepID=UPI001F0DD9F2|nr:N-acetylmuramoyl-L-alanine amidase [Streptomyces sp. JB150]